MPAVAAALPAVARAATVASTPEGYVPQAALTAQTLASAATSPATAAAISLCRLRLFLGLRKSLRLLARVAARLHIKMPRL